MRVTLRRWLGSGALARAHRLAHLDQRRQRRRRLAAAAHEELLDVFRRGAPAALGLHHHVVLLGVALVAGDDAATEHGLDRARHRVHRDAHVGGAGAVDVQEDLGLVQLQVAVGLHDARVLLHLGDHGLRRARHILVAVAADDDEVQRQRTESLTQAGRRHRKHGDAGQRHDLRQQLARQFLCRDVALGPVDGAQDAERAGHLAAADEHEAAVELRVLRRDRVQRVEVARGVLQRGAVGRADRHRDDATVLHRRQLALGGAEQPPAAATRGDHHQHHQPTVRQRPAQRADVDAGHADQQVLHAAVEAVRRGVVAQQLAAHHRRQRQRHETRHQHRAGQRERELAEQSPGAPGREGQRREHRRQSERHRDDGKADLAHALECGLERRQALLDMAEDVLQHHDRVVDHQADGQHQRQQRERVDGEAGQRDEREGTHQAHGYGHQRNDRRAQGAQEDEHHQRHQHHGFDHRRVDGLDRAVDEDRVVVGLHAPSPRPAGRAGSAASARARHRPPPAGWRWRCG